MNKTLTLGKNRYPPFQQVLCVENSSGLAAWNGQPAVLKALIGIRKWLASGVCLVPKMVSGVRVKGALSMFHKIVFSFETSQNTICAD